MNETPTILTYTRAICCDTIAVLNDLQVKTSDVENAFSLLHVRNTFGQPWDLGLEKMLVRRLSLSIHFMV